MMEVSLKMGSYFGLILPRQALADSLWLIARRETLMVNSLSLKEKSKQLFAGSLWLLAIRRPLCQKRQKVGWELAKGGDWVTTPYLLT
jgi:hypothetical protein